MKRTSAIAISAIFAIIAPGTVAGIVPRWMSRWRIQAPFLHFYGFRVTGILFILASLPVLLDSFARFALQGLGTPAPPFPTRHLVVTGLYRYVRKPMYVAVVGLIAGQALLLGNRALLFYAIIVCMAYQIFVLLYEETLLRKTYTAEYELFCRNVPRWLH